MTEQISQLKEENDQLKTNLEILDQENMRLHERLSDLEQYSKMNNVIINGNPSMERENL